MAQINFDDGLLPGSWWGTNSLAVVADPDCPEGGNYLEQTYTPTPNGPNGTEVVGSWQGGESGRTIYLRFWYYLESPWDTGSTFDGGKFHGLAGGSRPTGGATNTDGFSARFAWDESRNIDIYAYHQDRAQNYPYGDVFPSNEQYLLDQWACLSMRVTMNTGPSNFDGSVTAWHNGVQIINQTGLRWQTSGTTPYEVDTFAYSSFFGGGGAWAPPQIQKARFDDFEWGTSDPGCTTAASSCRLGEVVEPMDCSACVIGDSIFSSAQSWGQPANSTPSINWTTWEAKGGRALSWISAPGQCPNGCNFPCTGDGTQCPSGEQILCQYMTAANCGSEVLVIELGANDVFGQNAFTTWSNAVDAAVACALANGFKEIIWLTIFNNYQYSGQIPQTRVDQYNKKLIDKAASTPEMTICDWYGLVVANGWTTSLGNDGLHPNTVQSQAMIDMTASCVEQACARLGGVTNPVVDICQNQSVNVQLTPTGAAYNYVSGGASGLNMSTSGLITGTTGVAIGVYPLVVTVNGVQTTYDLNVIDCSGGPGIPSASDSEHTGHCQGTPFSLTLGTPCGTSGGGGLNLLTNGDFSSGFSGWQADIPYAGDDVYAFDNSNSVQTGPANYAGGVVQQTAFPGDPANNVPAKNNWLYSNGNNSGGTYTMMGQTVNGLVVGQQYELCWYASNAIAPNQNFADDTTYDVVWDNGTLGSFVEIDHIQVPEQDIWHRRCVTFTATATSHTFKWVNTRLGFSGNDVGFACMSLTSPTVGTGATCGLITDSDHDPSQLTVTILSDSCGGASVALVGGEWVLTANPGVIGTCAITYRVVDPLGGTDTGTIKIGVINCNPGSGRVVIELIQ